MRIGIISDIHGNLTAAEAALNALQKRGYDVLVALGDDIGFGPSPAQCCALLEHMGALRIRGNHEQRMFKHVQGRMPEIDGALQWATERWTACHTPDYVYALPDTRVLDTGVGEALLIHDVRDAPPHIGTNTKLVLSGHIHKPVLRYSHGIGYLSPGSAGFSMQGDPYTADCALLTVDGSSVNVEFIIVPYDAARAIALFERSELMKLSPQLSRVMLESMRTGRDTMLPFLRVCGAIMDERGIDAPVFPDDVWREAFRRTYGGA